MGRLTLDGLPTVIEEVKSLFGTSPFSVELASMLDTALEGSNQYNDFVFKLLNQLFGRYGLIVLNMDDVALKDHFKG